MKRRIDPELYKQLIKLHSELPTVTCEEMKSLMPMFASSDKEIRELASQTLYTTNFFAIPSTISILLSLYPTPTLSEME